MISYLKIKVNLMADLMTTWSPLSYTYIKILEESLFKVHLHKCYNTKINSISHQIL